MLRRNRDSETARQETDALARPGGMREPLTWFDEVDRWFDEIRKDVERSLRWPLAARSRAVADARLPVLDVRDTGSEFIVTAELPGAAKEDIQIQATPEVLEIRADAQSQREEEDENFYFRERGHRSWYRNVPLPAEIVSERVSANLKDGILEVRLPKREPTTTSEPIKVKVE